jgi:rhodanese-related sulfurtransferase
LGETGSGMVASEPEPPDAEANDRTQTQTNQSTFNKQMKKAATLLASLAFAFAVFAGEFPDVSVSEVKALVENKKAVIIDVNGSDSFAKGHVPGALDYEVIKNQLAEKLPKDKNTLIVAYCGGPACKAYQAAATAAEKLGYKNVKHMSAGISGWKEAGQKVEKKDS